jgi:hypothetical protein
MANEFAPIMFSMIETLVPGVIFNFFVEGMNKRLLVECADIACLATEAAN